MRNPIPNRFLSRLSRRRISLGLVLPFALTFGLALSPSARATDGVAEINHTCAVQTGCFSGDAAGFPVTITASGSYRLTSNLDVASTATTAIDISTNDVTLDLNGFALVGVNSCQGDPVTSCTASTGGRGISGMTARNVRVRNGTVRGMGTDGILLDRFADIRNVSVIENGTDGIECENGCRVTDCEVLRNGGRGINNRNTGGSPVGSAGRHEGNVISGNLERGLFTQDQSVLVTGNSFYGNGGTGLGLFSVAGGYIGNVFEENNGGSLNAQVDGVGIEMGTNICGSNTTCP